jgi:hypothetical protein
VQSAPIRLRTWSATIAKTGLGSASPRAASVATRRSAACSSAMRRSSARASALVTAVASSSVNRWIRNSVPAGNAFVLLEDAATTPHRCPSTMIGQPSDERMPSSRASAAIAPSSKAKLETRAGPPLRSTSRATLTPSSSMRVPTASRVGTRLHAATPVTLPSGS